MNTAGLLGILLGIYLLVSAFKNRKPVDTIKQIIQKPGAIKSALNSGDGYVYTPTYDATKSGFDGGGAATGGGGGGWSLTSSDSDAISTALAFALAQRGKPYVWGGVGTNNSQGGYDCSGLVYSAYRKAGVDIPRTTATQLASTKLEKITKNDLQAGDLVYPFPGHVQLYLGNNQIIEAPGRGRNVRVKTLGSVWAARRIKALYKGDGNVVV